ncbi:hypothetical protein N7517_007462 [Penicillium concentricum]|uniref:Mitochondrial mRNA processing protein PET127 n=1 Tax=Penicillium concentricum TaxID=293559 RepID=A0A9W9SB78_9EURO|nr:uncharacterized protein N7517_007462 [Penicillium concentricum]KAJ5375456.1 hypothetical protein N7517_007462 [Penicillium concentricum]
MLRTSLRSVSGPSSRHVCLSCLARPGALGLRQFHRISALRTDSGETKPEANSFDASIQPPAPPPPNGQTPEIKDGASSEPQKSSRPPDSPRVLTAATWAQMNKPQRRNYRNRHSALFNKFRESMLANREITLKEAVELEIARTKTTEQEAAPLEAPIPETALSEATPSKEAPSEAVRVEADQIKALQQKMRATELEARRERKAKFKAEKSLANAKQEAKILKGKEKESQLKAEIATDGPADTPAASEPKETLNLKSTSNVVAQILETSSENGVASLNEPSLEAEREEKEKEKEKKKKEEEEEDGGEWSWSPWDDKSQSLPFLEDHVTSRDRGSLNSKDRNVHLKEVRTPMPPVPRVAFGLDRVLFNPGVYQLRDPRSLVYNFDPYLDQIMPVSEFDFDTLKPYVTSSKDVTACEMTKKHEKKYYGSSSSMTSVLSHFHYLLSAWRPVDTSKLTQSYGDPLRSFTRLLRAPTAMFLRYNEKEDIYAIDADKEYDTANILMHLGKSMEKQLTLPKEKFERYRRSDANKITAEEEASVPESYHYSTIGKFLLRSQLDAYDPRLPGTGMFDLKTRAVVSIRMEPLEHKRGMGYEIRRRFGKWESYEREYFDMIRAAFLKYSLQVRVGRMDGIFVAYHNTERIFGFQYITLEEMDEALHGSSNTELGDTEFELSLGLWEKILDKATERFPKKSLRFHFETCEGPTPFMHIIAQPVTDEQIDAIQSKNQAQVDAITERLFYPDRFDGSEATEFEPEAEAEPEPEPEAEPEPPKENTEAEAKSIGNSLADALFPIDPAESAAEQAAELEYDTSFELPGLNPDSIAEPKPKPRKPRFVPNPNLCTDYDENLLAMTLVINNKVNGAPVERPGHFTKSDKWTIDYELDEISVEQGNAVLQAVKRRRNLALRKNVQDHSNDFFAGLQKLAEKGRAFRKRLDKIDRDRGILVYKDSCDMDV